MDVTPRGKTNHVAGGVNIGHAQSDTAVDQISRACPTAPDCFQPQSRTLPAGLRHQRNVCLQLFAAFN
jgi:hypothetical protein